MWIPNHSGEVGDQGFDQGLSDVRDLFSVLALVWSLTAHLGSKFP